MEGVRYILIDFGFLALGASATLTFLFFIRNMTLRVVRRWTAKKLVHYRAAGMEVQIAPFAVEHFAGTVAMCMYGLVLVLMSVGIVVLGYQAQSTGLNPDMKVLWSLATVGGLIGLSWVSLMGHSAYRRWSNSFVTLESEYLSINNKST